MCRRDNFFFCRVPFMSAEDPSIGILTMGFETLAAISVVAITRCDIYRGA